MSTWKRDQREMNDVYAKICITAEGVRGAMSEDTPRGTIHIPATSPVDRLGLLIDLELAGVKDALLHECVAQYCVERGVQDFDG